MSYRRSTEDRIRRKKKYDDLYNSRRFYPPVWYDHFKCYYKKDSIHPNHPQYRKFVKRQASHKLRRFIKSLPEDYIIKGNNVQRCYDYYWTLY